MLKLSLFTLPLAALLAFHTVPTRADSLSCVTVNGQTKCAYGANSASCTAVGNRIVCHGDSDAQTPNSPQQIAPGAKPPPSDGGPDKDQPDDDDDDALPPLLLPPDKMAEINSSIWMLLLARPYFQSPVTTVVPAPTLPSNRQAIADVIRHNHELLVRNGKEAVHIRICANDCGLIHSGDPGHHP